MRTIKLLAIIITMMIICILINYLFIEKLIIPDPCYYHTHEAGKLFKMFYSIPAWNGFHPFPTSINFITTLFIGGILGFIIGKRIIKRHTTKPKIHNQT